jgi:hypothetical protein
MRVGACQPFWPRTSPYRRARIREDLATCMARTISDLSGAATIDADHATEAITYRSLEQARIGDVVTEIASKHYGLVHTADG